VCSVHYFQSSYAAYLRKCSALRVCAIVNNLYRHIWTSGTVAIGLYSEACNCLIRFIDLPFVRARSVLLVVSCCWCCWWGGGGTKSVYPGWLSELWDILIRILLIFGREFCHKNWTEGKSTPPPPPPFFF